MKTPTPPPDDAVRIVHPLVLTDSSKSHGNMVEHAPPDRADTLSDNPVFWELVAIGHLLQLAKQRQQTLEAALKKSGVPVSLDFALLLDVASQNTRIAFETNAALYNLQRGEDRQPYDNDRLRTALAVLGIPGYRVQS